MNMENVSSVSNSQTQSTATPLNGTIYNGGSYCSNRLPCGYCMLLSKPCPMQSYVINPCNPFITYTTGSDSNTSKVEKSSFDYEVSNKV